MSTKALLVGINKYPRSQDRLNGCVNDVTDVRDLLSAVYRVPGENIRILLDSEATLANIKTNLQWLAVPDGDGKPATRLFHYSGHGSQVADSGKGDEPDGSDECLVPFDYQLGGMLIDDVLREQYRTFQAKTHLLLLMDCCHSGTNQRALRSDGKISRARFLVPSEEEHAKIEAAAQRFQQETRKAVVKHLKKARDEGATDAELEALAAATIEKFQKKRFGHEEVKGNVILIAGCHSSQTAADAKFGSRFNGALSYYLLETLKKANGKLSYFDLISKVGDALTTNHFEQTPQLECSAQMKKSRFLNIE